MKINWNDKNPKEWRESNRVITDSWSSKNPIKGWKGNWVIQIQINLMGWWGSDCVKQIQWSNEEPMQRNALAMECQEPNGEPTEISRMMKNVGVERIQFYLKEQWKFDWVKGNQWSDKSNREIIRWSDKFLRKRRESMAWQEYNLISINFNGVTRIQSIKRIWWSDKNLKHEKNMMEWQLSDGDWLLHERGEKYANKLMWRSHELFCHDERTRCHKI